MGVSAVSGPTGPTGEPCMIVGLSGFAWLLAGLVLVAYWREWRRRQ